MAYAYCVRFNGCPLIFYQIISHEKGGIMRKTLVALTVFTAVLVVASGAFAQDVKHFQLSLFNPIQIFNEDTSIHGLRLSIYGVNEDMFGADFGIVPQVNGDMVGWQGGIFNIINGDMKGFQDGIVNITRGDFIGWQSGYVNICKSKFTGFQSSFVNISSSFSGLQFGVVNVADSLYGLQIGIVNINKSGDPHEFLPIVNYAF